MSNLTSNGTTEYKAMEDVKIEPKKTVIHLKDRPGVTVCSKCNAEISNDGVYTYKEDIFNEPPPGYTNCKSIWAE